MSDPKLSLVIATCHQPDWRRCVDSWAMHAAEPFNAVIIEDRELMEAYQLGLESTNAPIIAFIHDDVIVEEDNWDRWVLSEFDDPTVGSVGFGGALDHGDPDMYRKPYELSQLARRHYRSNMRDAEVHGERFTLACDVAVLDGFAMFVRREILERAGGWPNKHPVGYYGYDYWLCCETRRQGYRIRLVGVKCDHLGGKSTGMGPTEIGQRDFEAAHEYIYQTCRDVLPYEVPR